jgi:hypothetical protein
VNRDALPGQRVACAAGPAQATPITSWVLALAMPKTCPSKYCFAPTGPAWAEAGIARAPPTISANTDASVAREAVLPGMGPPLGRQVFPPSKFLLAAAAGKCHKRW